MKKHQATLIEKTGLGPGLFSLWLEFDDPGHTAPGQFFEFRTAVRFLRRAVSIADRKDNRLRFVVKTVGPGTSWLSQIGEGAKIDVFGPLGQGVMLTGEGKVMLLAGGIGSAPLYYLARTLHEQNIDVDAIISARKAQQLILVEEYEKLCRTVVVTTDDGSAGKKGLLTDILPAFSGLNNVNAFYACGPEPMFRALKMLHLDRPIYAFLESRMGCGTGLCVGCAIKGKDGRYHRVCLEGPVYDLEEIEI